MNVRDLGGLPTEDGRPDTRRRCRSIGQHSSSDRRRLALARRRTASSGSSTCAGPRSSPRTRRATSRSRSSTSRCSGDAFDPDVRRRARRAPARGRATSPITTRGRTSTSSSAIATASAARSPRSPMPTARSSCTAWAARTAPGLVAALLLRLAGVGLERRSAPTTRSRRRTSRRRRRRWIEAAADDDERAKREKLSHTPAEGMVRTLAEIERRYGDVGGVPARRRADRRPDRAAAGAPCRCLSCATSKPATARSARCTASR